MRLHNFIILSAIFFFTACSQDSGLVNVGTDPVDTTNDNSNNSSDCTDVATLDNSRGDCSETLAWQSEMSIVSNGNEITITTNGIPNHAVGLFGSASGSINPNAVSEQNAQYTITSNPAMTGNITLLSDGGPKYTFGVTLGGIEIDPEAAEPWPHTRPTNFNTANWDWNLDAMSINLGLDCNNAHVQPSGKYHHHGTPTLYLDKSDISEDEMLMVGYAGDGFPIYHKLGYTDPNSSASEIIELTSSYRLKSGERPGDGETAPCGAYTGIYTADYEYVQGLGDLDVCNGRQGVTPEYPEGTYYYVITETYPYVGRCFVGTPSADFTLR